MTTDSAKEIMNALELRYGNQGTIIDDLVSSLQKLPSLSKKEIGLISFACTVKSNVAVIVSVGYQGYLKNPELIGIMVLKLPDAMVYRYNEFASSKKESPNLEISATFLIREAEMANKAGTTFVNQISSAKGRDSSRNS